MTHDEVRSVVRTTLAVVGRLAACTRSPADDVLAAILRANEAKLADAVAELLKDPDQPRAAAIVHRYSGTNLATRPLWDLLLRYAVSEDGALHGEKFYRTTSEEFARTRPAFRWRQLVALARVTASEYGKTAPGYDEAKRLLGV